MAFNTKETNNKNQFVASMVSKATGDVASWVNLTETMCTKVFGKKLEDISAEEAQDKLPIIYDTSFLFINIKDITIPLGEITIEATAF